MKTNRIVRIRIENDTGLGYEFKSSDPANNKRGFKMDFRVSKTPSSDPNQCVVSIVNLNQDSRNKINTKNSKLFVYAGYQNDTGDELIFVGDITSVNSEIQKPEVITKIEAGDGDKKLKDVKLSISFKEGSSVLQVVQKAIDKLGLPIKTKSFLEPLSKIKFNNGKSFMGTAKKLLDVIFAGANMDWSIQNDEIKFYTIGKVDNSSAVVLSSGVDGGNNTGLIGSPMRIKIKKSSQDSSPEVDGWKFKSLLSPKIEPGGIIVASSKEIPERSNFKVTNVEHSGNTTEGEFVTITEGIQV